MEKPDGSTMKYLAFISLIIPLMLLGQRNMNLDESFDPTMLKDWDDGKARIEKLVSLREYKSQLHQGSDSTTAGEYYDFVYRVQLGSTSDYDAAIAFEQRANSAFTEDVMIQFDSPYYKIRVGKMNNREDAQTLQQLAIQQGYRRAWVVRTENSPQKEN
jgi:hypothetical protein